MCGIVGYVGKKQCTDILIGALSKLEYRGYDSAGIAVFENNKIKEKSVRANLRTLSIKLKKKVSLQEPAG